MKDTSVFFILYSSTMRRWQPQSTSNRWVSVLLLLLATGGVVYVGQILARQVSGPPETWQFDLTMYAQLVLFCGLLLLVGALTYRVVSAFTLSYELDRNGLYINWIGNRMVVPLDQIQSVDIGVIDATRRWNPLSYIGYFSGQRRTADGKLVHLFSSQPLARALTITTGDGVYAISPVDTEGFVQDLEQRRNLGATKPLASAVEPGRMFLYAFWHDRTVRALLVAAFALNLGVLALLAVRYPGLSSMVEMRFNAAGQVTEMKPRHEALFLPMAALALSLLNVGLGLFIYRGQQVGARLLQGASVIVQILFGIAVVTIIG